MSAFDDALATAAVLRGPRCATSEALDKLPPGERKSVLAAIDNPNVPGADIARALDSAFKVAVKGDQVLRHRRRSGVNGCSCPR